MGAGTSPAGGTHTEGPAEEAVMSEQAGPTGKTRDPEAASGEAVGAGVQAEAGESAAGARAHGPGSPERPDAAGASARDGGTDADADEGRTSDRDGGPDTDASATADLPSEPTGSAEPSAEATASGGADASASTDAAVDTDGTAVAGGSSGSTWVPPRRFSLTRDTARPEGGGRAAPGDAPAPARQWPLLTVLCTAGAGLLIVGVDPFKEAFRYGSMLVGIALLAGAVLRWVVPSVGMLAVRSRFTDLVTYGLMGTLIVLIATMAQPRPWLNVPFLQDVVHFTIR
ncbi:DUF3017 domain-containing protein [Streptomyces sp. NPDC057428]|uniref:DUF3017 domain-containing protein n=1 Tax=Streptomyces sp. NPDC057428 TaxID=3346129 RepID=UPI00369356C0